MKTLRQGKPAGSIHPAAIWSSLKGMMEPIRYVSTNGTEKVTFRQALMDGLAPDYGLYMPTKIPKLPRGTIKAMRNMSYPEIAATVVAPYLGAEVPRRTVERLMHEAYGGIGVDVKHLFDHTHVMWLTGGPTASFKDYAARFYAAMLSHFLGGERKVVVVATSGDTGGAVAHALHGRDNVGVAVIIPKGRITERQRRQMTTLRGNVHVLELNLPFSGCQELAKLLLSDRKFAHEAFGDPCLFTSANSISIARLLPQAVYPFYAHSRAAEGREMTAVIPSGNFGDMMGTAIAGRMGLPLSRIVCALNANRIFADFLRTGRYEVRATVETPASAMDVDHPSNVARLVHLYGGHMSDRREGGRVVEKGVVDAMPDLDAMRRDIWALSVSTKEIRAALARAHAEHGTLLDPHGAVGYHAAMRYNGYYEGSPARTTGIPTVIYETADPAKFPETVYDSTRTAAVPPKGIRRQALMEERVYHVGAAPDEGPKLSQAQIDEAKGTLRAIFTGNRNA